MTTHPLPESVTTEDNRKQVRHKQQDKQHRSQERSHHRDNEERHPCQDQNLMACFTCSYLCNTNRDHAINAGRSTRTGDRTLATPLEEDVYDEDDEGNNTLNTKPLIVLDDASDVAPAVTDPSPAFHENLVLDQHQEDDDDDDDDDDVVDIDNPHRFPSEAFDTYDSDDGNDSCFTCGRGKNKLSGQNNRRRQRRQQQTYQRNQQPDYDLEEDDDDRHLGKYHHPKETLATPTPQDDPTTSSLNQSLSF